MSVAWPAGVPSRIRLPFSGGPQSTSASFDAEIGPALRRPRSTIVPEVYTFVVESMTRAQFGLWREWYKTQLKGGAIHFTMQNPASGGDGVWQMVEPYAFEMEGPYFRVSFTALLVSEIVPPPGIPAIEIIDGATDGKHRLGIIPASWGSSAGTYRVSISGSTPVDLSLTSTALVTLSNGVTVQRESTIGAGFAATPTHAYIVTFPSGFWGASSAYSVAQTSAGGTTGTAATGSRLIPGTGSGTTYVAAGYVDASYVE